jgi:hypothetical protein
MVRARIDSPGETRLRLCLVLAGLPEPCCNITLGTDNRPIGRVDPSGAGCIRAQTGVREVMP